jgi:MFS family permease
LDRRECRLLIQRQIAAADHLPQDSYALCFSVFLLFFGRLADLYEAKTVFTLGFAFSGLFAIISSVQSNYIAFFVFTGCCGMSASATIPSAYRLISGVFPPTERPLAIMFFGIAGGITSAIGELQKVFLHIPERVALTSHNS